jgi:hypothetical protein
MNKVTSFKVGENYTNDQIRFSLDLENLGGIRPSLDSDRGIRHVAIMTAAEDSGRLAPENPYRDRIEQNILIYTAQGREGDRLWRAGINGLLNNTRFRRHSSDLPTSVDKHIDSSGSWNCFDTTKKVKPILKEICVRCGYSNF